MIRRISIIAFASILLASCAVLTVEDVGDGNYYVNGVLADGAIYREQKTSAGRKTKRLLRSELNRPTLLDVGLQYFSPANK